MKKKIFTQRGTTLVELSIAMLITSIVVSGAFQAYQYVTKSTDRENKKALIQKEIITVSQLLARDVRMAGLGLPGNGVQFTLSDDSSDQIEIFSNESKSKTFLTTNLNYEATSILVADCSGGQNAGWVCIAGLSVDTVYRRITGVGESGSMSPDTVYLSGKVGAGTFTDVSTQIYFCNRAVYSVKKTGSELKLVIQRNNIEVSLGEKLDTLSIEPKNNAGVTLTGGFEKAVSVAIMIGGYVGSGTDRNLISEVSQVNIRNKN